MLGKCALTRVVQDQTRSMSYKSKSSPCRFRVDFQSISAVVWVSVVLQTADAFTLTEDDGKTIEQH